MDKPSRVILYLLKLIEWNWTNQADAFCGFCHFSEMLCFTYTVSCDLVDTTDIIIFNYGQSFSPFCEKDMTCGYVLVNNATSYSTLYGHAATVLL